MPVLEHEVHERTRHTSEHRYGCHNKVPGMFFGYYAPDREYLPGGGYREIVKLVQNTMSQECRYDLSESDNSCAGCANVGVGAKYAASVRASGK
jgi:hypothetical protein